MEALKNSFDDNNNELKQMQNQLNGYGGTVNFLVEAVSHFMRQQYNNKANQRANGFSSSSNVNITELPAFPIEIPASALNEDPNLGFEIPAPVKCFLQDLQAILLQLSEAQKTHLEN